METGSVLVTVVLVADDFMSVLTSLFNGSRFYRLY